MKFTPLSWMAKINR